LGKRVKQPVDSGLESSALSVPEKGLYLLHGAEISATVGLLLGLLLDANFEQLIAHALYLLEVRTVAELQAAVLNGSGFFKHGPLARIAFGVGVRDVVAGDVDTRVVVQQRSCGNRECSGQGSHS